MTETEAAVRKQLIGFVVAIEIASLAGLGVLYYIRVVFDKTGLLLLFLLPIAFGLHVTEEFIFPGGFIAWRSLYLPQYSHVTGRFYVLGNAIPGSATLLLAAGAFNYAGRYNAAIQPWLTILTFMSLNAFFHLGGAIRTRRYSPGVVTGVGLFPPLTIVSYVHFVHGGLSPWVAGFAGAQALAVGPVLMLIAGRKRKTAG
jgi:Protein of unknown function with HXXEE motif